MPSKDYYYQKPCNKIDASCINAYLELKLDDQDPSKLHPSTTLGARLASTLNRPLKTLRQLLTCIFSPAENPVALQYDPERGEPDCIHGDDLSRIISLSLLKDVDQVTKPTNGDVLIYRDGKWYTFNLTAALKAITDRLDVIETTLTKPTGIPGNARLVWGNINLYSDYTNTNNRNWGFYTHSTNTNIPDRREFRLERGVYALQRL
jgi:hypothetical protein